MGKSKQAAFTLIELLVVVIIVAVLAAVGIPLLSANVVRAKASELEAGLGTARTGLRAKFAELGTYPDIPAGTLVTAADIGLRAGDLNGRFCTDSCYKVTSNATTYCISADGNLAGAAAKGADADSKSVKRAMDQDGKLSKDTLICS